MLKLNCQDQANRKEKSIKSADIFRICFAQKNKATTKSISKPITSLTLASAGGKASF